MSLWKSKSGVINATESESEESERFHFFRLRLQLRRLRSAYMIQWKLTRLSESEAEAEGYTNHIARFHAFVVGLVLKIIYT